MVLEKRVHVKTWLFSKTESLFNPLPGVKGNVTFHSCFGAEVASLVTTVSLQDNAYDSDGIDYLRESSCLCSQRISLPLPSRHKKSAKRTISGIKFLDEEIVVRHKLKDFLNANFSAEYADPSLLVYLRFCHG